MTFSQAVRSLVIGAGILAAVSGVSPLCAKERPAAAAPAPAQSQPSGRPIERIAAVVNDEAISVLDLEARFRLAILGANLPDNPETRQQLMPQVLRSLLEEKLQLQEAKRLNFTVAEPEIDVALTRIAEQNRMPRSNLEKFLGSRNVPLATLVQQIKANIAWTKLIQRKLRPSIQIGGDEIDAALERIRSNIGKPEYLVAEIFLAVENASQEDQVRRSAERLIDQIKQGTPFSAVARQFSQAAGAGSGGDLGWVQPGQLPEELDRVLLSSRAGTLSMPIRSATGYHILLVRDQRTISTGNPAEVRVQMKQRLFPVTAGNTRQTQLARAVEFGRKVNGCGEFDAQLRAAGETQGSDMGTVRAGDLAPELGRLVSTIPIGRVSPPMGNERQVVVIIVCDRKTPEAGLPSRDLVFNQLSNERLDMLQRRYLIDLKRSAYVDVRM